LVISRDPKLADVRYRVLVNGDYDVISATDIRGVIAGCGAKPDAAMIGYSVPSSEKRRIWTELKKCRVAILELYKDNPPVISAAMHHKSQTPEDFLEAVNKLLGRQPVPKAARKGAS